MLKRSLLTFSSLIILSSLVACQSRLDDVQPDLQATQEVAQSDSVNISSISGVWKELKDSSKLAFSELDKNADKAVDPAEYGVATSDSEKSFQALDSNHDGKITEKEFTPNFFKKVGLTLRLKAAARKLFTVLDTSKNKLLSKEELTSNLVSPQFVADFDKYDKEGGFWLWKNPKGGLNKSEFENLFAEVAIKKIAPPAPAPVDPAPAPASK